MSETWTYVACTCFRDGLTSEPPVPRSELTYDRFGNVLLVGSRSGDDDPEALWDWRSGWEDQVPRACPHDFMRVIEEIWEARGAYVSRLEPILRLGGPFHHLEEVLHCGNTIMSAAHIVASPELARLAIPELDQILGIDPQGRTRVVVDQSGREIVAPIDPEGYSRQSDFVRLDLVDRNDDLADGVLDLGLVEDRFVVRQIGEPGVVLLEASELSYEVPEKPRFRDRGKGHHPEWTFIDAESGDRVTGYVSPTWLGRRWYGYLLPPAGPLILRVAERDLQMADFAWYLPRLRPFLEASVATGNPIVQYHSGSSLGLD